MPAFTVGAMVVFILELALAFGTAKNPLNTGRSALERVTTKSLEMIGGGPLCTPPGRERVAPGNSQSARVCVR